MTTNITKMPSVGEKAPDFTLPSNSGDSITLSALKGKPVVVYFYPKDNTPGCTTEAKGFQEHISDFDQAGAVVLGISPDGVDSHCKFAEKYGLRFALLADEGHSVAQQYGVWVEKNNYGKKYMGVQRATFLVDKDGTLAYVWPKVKPDGHPEEVLAALSSI